MAQQNKMFAGDYDSQSDGYPPPLETNLTDKKTLTIKGDEMPQLDRNPPNFRRPDCCSKCRAFNFGECDYYKMGTSHPDDWVCDDFKPE